MTTFTVTNVEERADGSPRTYATVTLRVAGAAYDSTGHYIGGASFAMTDAAGNVTIAGLTVGVPYVWTHPNGDSTYFTAASAGTYTLQSIATGPPGAGPGAVTPDVLTAAVAAAMAGGVPLATYGPGGTAGNIGTAQGDPRYGPGGTAGNYGATQGDARWTQKANNLSDVATPATARGNLGAAQASRTGNRAVGQDEQLVYAMDHAVVADGVTDDTTALTAAITATPTRGVLVLPPNANIRITSPLSITKTMTVRGSGQFTSRIFCDGCDGLYIGAAGTPNTGVNYVKLEHFEIAQKVRYTTTTNTYTGIHVFGATGSRPTGHIYRDIFLDGFQTAINSEWLWSSEIHNVRAGSGLIGLDAYGLSVNNFLHSCQIGTASVTGSRPVRLNGQNSSTDATAVASEGWTIYDNLFDSGDVGVEIIGNAHIVVADNIIDHCLTYGVLVRDNGTNFAGNSKISGNYIAMTGASGIAAIDINNTVANSQLLANRIVSNHVIVYSGQTCTYGVYIQGSSSLSTVTGNVFNGFGADIRAQIADNTITDNRCLTASPSPVNIYSTFRQMVANNVGTYLNSAGDPVWYSRPGGVNRVAYGTQAPTGGTLAWAAGDRVVNRTPAVGSPKAWTCTVAGSPGTWVSEGNL